jgi:hypothetical protein
LHGEIQRSKEKLTEHICERVLPLQDISESSRNMKDIHTYWIAIFFLTVSFCVTGAKGEEVDERDSTTPALDNILEFGYHPT